DLIQPPQPKDHIAIVSEWDTFFGRALPLSFAAAATKQDISTFTPFTAQNFPENIHPFVYLRGIDGQTPGEPSASSNKESNKDTDKDSAGNATKVSAPGEAPEGLNQADYLRRLADQIAALDAKLRRRPGNSSGIRAIGILGSDVYDKLLVLRALRDRLPEPIFFTTAMDARYTLPSETVATHNLLVVSPFGLNLNETYQANIPSFRDSYQTAVFTASMWAVIGIPGDESHASNDPKLQLPPAVQRAMSIKQQMYLGDPRRFEIGLKGAHDLTVPGKPEAGILKFPRDEPVWKSFQPFREDYPVREVVLGGILPVALTLGILCLLALALGVRPDRNVMTDGCKFIVHMVTAAPFWLALAFIAVLVLWIQVDCWDGASGEPVALLDGVSIWPTESIRLLAFFLCFYFVAYCWLDAHKNDLEIRDEFDLKDFEEMETYAGNDAFCTTVAPAKSYWQWIKGRLWKYGFILCDWNVVGMPSTGTKTKPRVAEGKEPESADARVFAQNVWWEYQRRRKPWARGGRVLLLTLCYLLFTTALLNHVFAEPAPPVRGPYAHTVDRWIHWASLIASTALTFFVLDATYTNRRLIQYLLSHTTHWPPKAYDQCAWTKNPEDMTEYLDIRFIAKRTHAVGEVIYYPFVILFLLILARNSWFDDWKWSMGLIVVTALDFGLAITAALMLRGAAEEARRRALKKIRDRRLRCQDEPTAKKLSEVAELVENEQDGAFSILSRHPLLAAILLPSGTLGIWVLLEYVPKLFH
ncbi:MAG TPA: hypothetical protein VHS31_12450, partial [Tepidisphaeraceae bacterium]|nr:hypothetical protein [Tepidisphaeraceae bacterium]